MKILVCMQILAITTDAAFHTPAEDPRYYDVDAIIGLCSSKNIKVIFHAFKVLVRSQMLCLLVIADAGHFLRIMLRSETILVGCNNTRYSLNTGQAH